MRRAACSTVMTVASALVAAALPAAAGAATAKVDRSYDGRSGEHYESVDYSAAPGEANDLSVTVEERQITLRDPVGIAPGRGCMRPDANDRTLVVCPVSNDASPGGTPTVVLGDRDDRASVTAGGADLQGGDGNDVLRAGPDGGPMAGGRGNDELVGAGGRDFFREGRSSSGSDTIVGGGQDDSLSYAARRRGVRVDLDGDPDDGERGERDRVAADIERVEGGRGDDRLRGNGGPNKLSGGRGSDRVSGGGGDDEVEGTTNSTGALPIRGERDRLSGGSGDDLVYGGDAALVLSGGRGQDQLWGGARGDSIRARDGEADALYCFGGRDRVTADAHDFVSGERGNGRCERLRRRGRAAAVLATVGPVFVNTVFPPGGGTSIEISVGCPADGPRRCVGRLRVLQGGQALHDKPFRVRRGQEGRRVVVRISRELREQVAREERVTLSSIVTSRVRGRAVVRRRPLVLDSDIDPR